MFKNKQICLGNFTHLVVKLSSIGHELASGYFSKKKKLFKLQNQENQESWTESWTAERHKFSFHQKVSSSLSNDSWS